MKNPAAILVVDDTLASLKLMVEILQAEGYQPRPANSGELALAAMAKQLPDLVLLDIRMPGMDGFEVCRRMKADERTRSIPVIFLSAEADAEERIKVFGAGGVDFVSKPFQREELLARINTHLELWNLRRNLEEEVARQTRELTETNSRLEMEIVEHQQTEEWLQTTNERNARQRAAMMELTRTCALPHARIADLKREVTQIAAEALEVERVGIWRYERDRQGIICQDLFERGAGSHSEGAVLRAEEVPAYFQALADGDLIAAHDAYSDPRTSAFSDIYLRHLGISSILDAPIHVMGSVAGVVCCEHVGPPRPWTTDEQAFAIALANVVSLLLAEEVRQQIEEQFRQMQKMESVGHLAGGVAHDFNNLLQVIGGYCQMLLLDPSKLPEGAKEDIHEIAAASDRAANLTRQLLAFSRKQVMQAQPLDLDDAIANLSKMLGRIIGEHIGLRCGRAQKPAIIHADVGMIEQVLVNLVVNARDAMPDGGEVSISTKVVTLDDSVAFDEPQARAGEFVRLTVRDTGTGIAAEDLTRIFEPFYTTKEVGKGTGLGLATVYGIVRQHQGWIEVSSLPGSGTTFKVFLPLLESAAVTEEAGAGTMVMRGGAETILLAEDDEPLRLLAQRILESQGYRVLTADSGPAALAVWAERGPDVELLLTDMVMPGGMTGRELALQLRARRPELKVIFMSGYSADLAGKDASAMNAENHFLQKPYSAHLLIQAVRECLDGEKA